MKTSSRVMATGTVEGDPDSSAPRRSACAASSAACVRPTTSPSTAARGEQDRLGDAVAREAAVRARRRAGAGRAGRRRRRSRGRSRRGTRAAPGAAAGRRPWPAATTSRRRGSWRSIACETPSISFSATLPVKPSVTTTSASPGRDLVALDVADEVERVALGHAVAQGGVRLEDERRALGGLLADREQADARALDRRARPGPARRP